MRRKGWIAGAAALLAGIGAALFIRSRDDVNAPDGAWTTADIPDLSGKVIIVTGANSGIGYEAAKEFARKGARTILASRDVEKGNGAREQILAEIPEALVEVLPLDLASLESIRRFAEAFRAKYGRLDVLLNNAGVMMAPYGVTEDGFELQFGTNHLGHFALTGLLIDLLNQTPGARVVTVSSNGHRSGEMDFENLQFEGGRGYTPMGAYARSKLANLLFTYELQRRLKANGETTIATAAHPGLSNTALADHFLVVRYLRPLVGFALQSAAMGALPSIRAALDPAAEGGEYYGPAGPRGRRGYPVAVPSSPASYNRADAQRLWDVSEERTGVHYL